MIEQKAKSLLKCAVQCNDDVLNVLELSETDFGLATPCHQYHGELARSIFELIRSRRWIVPHPTDSEIYRVTVAGAIFATQTQ